MRITEIFDKKETKTQVIDTDSPHDQKQELADKNTICLIFLFCQKTKTKCKYDQQQQYFHDISSCRQCIFDFYGIQNSRHQISSDQQNELCKSGNSNLNGKTKDYAGP